VQTNLPYRTAAKLADTIRVHKERAAQLERALKEARKQLATALQQARVLPCEMFSKKLQDFMTQDGLKGHC